MGLTYAWRSTARIVRPLLDITLLFLGLPLVVTRESRNVFLAIGMCIALSTAFMLVVDGIPIPGGGILPRDLPRNGRLGSVNDLRPRRGRVGRVDVEMNN